MSHDLLTTPTNRFPSLQHLHLYALYKAKYDSRSCLLPRRILITFTGEEEDMIYVSILPVISCAKISLLLVTVTRR